MKNLDERFRQYSKEVNCWSLAENSYEILFPYMKNVAKLEPVDWKSMFGVVKRYPNVID